MTEVEWIAAQEESKYSWAKQHPQTKQHEAWRDRSDIGRENFLLTVVKALGHATLDCNISWDGWYQPGDGKVEAAKPWEIAATTGGLVQL